jgi:hypothetical protein
MSYCIKLLEFDNILYILIIHLIIHKYIDIYIYMKNIHIQYIYIYIYEKLILKHYFILLYYARGIIKSDTAGCER